MLKLNFRFVIFLIFALATASASAFTLTQNSLQGFPDKILRISLNSTNCPTSIDSELAFAIDTWNNVPGSRLYLMRESSNTTAVNTWNSFGFPQTIMVGCSTSFTTDSGGAGLTVIGVGTSTMQGTGRLKKGYLILNEEGGQGRYSTQTASVRKFTMAHELGHVFGLGHSSVYESLMYPSVSSKSDVTLHQDDMDGIIYLYPIDELGDDMLYGCGRVSFISPGQGGNNGYTLWTLLLLLLPLGLVIHLRKRSRQALKISN